MCERGDGEQGDVQSIKTLASLVGQPAKQQCTDRGPGQCGAGHQRGFDACKVCDAEAVQGQRQHDADGRQVIAIGEDAHARGEQGQGVEAVEALLIYLVKGRVGGCGHEAAPSEQHGRMMGKPHVRSLTGCVRVYRTCLLVSCAGRASAARCKGLRLPQTRPLQKGGNPGDFVQKGVHRIMPAGADVQLHLADQGQHRAQRRRRRVWCWRIRR